jgi:hypothetical protein
MASRSLKLEMIAFAAGTALVMFGIDNSGAADPKSDFAIITEYVISHKHWRTNDFRIEKKECDCPFALYRIIYLPETRKPTVGDVKSFAVYYDSERRRVVEEKYFQ